MRLETGVFQPANDWPGIFIRGDNALMLYLPALKQAVAILRQSESTNGFYIGPSAALERLAKIMVECTDGLPRTGNSITISGTQWGR